MTVDREDEPVRPGIIRVSMRYLVWIRPNAEDPTITDYTEISTIDFGGYVPTMLLNMTLASESIKEFKLLYAHCKKD